MLHSQIAVAREVRAPRRQKAPSPTRRGGDPDSSGGALRGNVEVELILLFAAVAETLSFTKAAQRLEIDQSWLSHKIRQLEASLGLKLFVRNTRNVELTPAGLCWPRAALTTSWPGLAGSINRRPNFGVGESP